MWGFQKITPFLIRAITTLQLMFQSPNTFESEQKRFFQDIIKLILCYFILSPNIGHNCDDN